VNYNEGPLYAGLAWQTDKQSAPGLDVRHVFANGSYDFGVVKLLGSARRVTHPDSGADRTREYQMGLEVPVSDALVVSTGYARSTDKSADLQVAQRQGYGLLLTYALSKRTALYGGLQRNTEKMTNNTARLTAAGIHHTF
jgi:predicted porin